MASKKKSTASRGKGAKRTKGKSPNKKSARTERADDDATLSVLDGAMKAVIRQSFLR